MTSVEFQNTLTSLAEVWKQCNTYVPVFLGFNEVLDNHQIQRVHFALDIWACFDLSTTNVLLELSCHHFPWPAILIKAFEGCIYLAYFSFSQEDAKSCRCIISDLVSWKIFGCHTITFTWHYCSYLVKKKSCQLWMGFAFLSKKLFRQSVCQANCCINQLRLRSQPGRTRTRVWRRWWYLAQMMRLQRRRRRRKWIRMMVGSLSHQQKSQWQWLRAPEMGPPRPSSRRRWWRWWRKWFRCWRLRRMIMRSKCGLFVSWGLCDSWSSTPTGGASWRWLASSDVAWLQLTS